MIVKTKHKHKWEILEIERFPDTTQYGECRPKERQIVIKKSHKNKKFTVIHELIHAINFDYELGLTEKQVTGLEKSLIRFLTLNKSFFKYWNLINDGK